MGVGVSRHGEKLRALRATPGAPRSGAGQCRVVGKRAVRQPGRAD